jgi:two-component system NtrC family response regulator
MSAEPQYAGDDLLRDNRIGDDSTTRNVASVLIIDDEPGMRNFLKRALEKRFSLVEAAEDIATAENLRQRYHFDLLITDIRLPGKSGVEWIQELRDQGSMANVIFMTAHADLKTAIAALRAGAADFILKPFRADQMTAAIDRCLEQRKMQRENFVLRREVEKLFDTYGMVGECQAISAVCEVIKRVAPMPSTVLIEGESGTGKELAARAMHSYSGRSGIFVPINCGAISKELLESELFGHVKGAFTGAHQAREGLFTYANGGTLFLDEIGEMPLAMQAKLLRVFEDRTIRPVGANKEFPVDVRIIAATNRDLASDVKGGRFREDLFYRLNVLAIRMPALRERLDDIPALARHFLSRLSSELGVPMPSCDDSDLNRLKAYGWPGNVREFKNVIERCLLLNKKPADCLAVTVSNAPKPVDTAELVDLHAVEKRHILKVLGEVGNNKSEAARRLGISRKTLERKLQAWKAGKTIEDD